MSELDPKGNGFTQKEMLVMVLKNQEEFDKKLDMLKEEMYHLQAGYCIPMMNVTLGAEDFLDLVQQHLNSCIKFLHLICLLQVGRLSFI